MNPVESIRVGVMGKTGNFEAYLEFFPLNSREIAFHVIFSRSCDVLFLHPEESRSLNDFLKRFRGNSNPKMPTPWIVIFL